MFTLNSLLHTIKSIRQGIRFYRASVNIKLRIAFLNIKDTSIKFKTSKVRCDIINYNREKQTWQSIRIGHCFVQSIWSFNIWQSLRLCPKKENVKCCKFISDIKIDIATFPLISSDDTSECVSLKLPEKTEIILLQGFPEI